MIFSDDLMKQLHYIDDQITNNLSKKKMSDMESSQSYAPQSNQQFQTNLHAPSYKKRMEKTNQHTVEGKWTQEQHIQYILYINYHSKIFSSKEKRKSTRIFKSLSEFLGTRTPRQCRSHFQKLIKKYQRINNIRLHFIQLLGKEEYQRKYLILMSRIENTQSTKNENSQKLEYAFKVDMGIQTDPMELQLEDLPHSEVIKLINIYRQFQMIQLPFFNINANPVLNVTFP